ncbi:hypothetical protein SK128_001638, partial [Halocaridina rubra]
PIISERNEHKSSAECQQSTISCCMHWNPLENLKDSALPLLTTSEACNLEEHANPAQSSNLYQAIDQCQETNNHSTKPYSSEDISKCIIGIALAYELENIFQTKTNFSNLLEYQLSDDQNSVEINSGSYEFLFPEPNNISIIYSKCGDANKTLLVLKHIQREKICILKWSPDASIRKKKNNAPEHADICCINYFDIERMKGNVRLLLGKNDTTLIDYVIKNTDTDSGGMKLTLFEYLRFIMLAKIYKDDICLQDLYEHRFAITVSNTTSRSYVAFETDKINIFSSSCSKFINNSVNMIFLGEQLYKHENLRKSVVNWFWTTCHYRKTIIGRGNDSIHPTAWHYLSPYCQAKEAGLLFLIIIITSITIVGNILVLFVLFTSGLVYKDTFVIHTSLAITDLSLGLTSGILSIHDQLGLITGSLSLGEPLYFQNTSLFSISQMIEEEIDVRDVRFERNGYPAFCSVMMNMSTYMSLLLLTLYSFDRFRILSGNPLSCVQQRCGVNFCLILGVFFLIMMNLREDGLSFVGHFAPIIKLTLNYPAKNSKISEVVAFIIFSVGILASVIVVVLTASSYVLLHRREQLSQMELRIHHIQRNANMKYLTQTLFYMVILFLVAYIAFILDFLPQSTLSKFGHFLCWWIFMAGSSWNWLLYCFRGRLFRENAYKVFCGKKHYANTRNCGKYERITRV